MATPKKIQLDSEGLFDDILETTAVINWSTRYPVFTFAFYLNQLLKMDLKKVDDITFSHKGSRLNCSVYAYNDFSYQTSYFLVENNPECIKGFSEFSYFDKSLLIIGPDAESRLQHINNMMNSNEMQPSCIIGMEREQMRQSFINDGIIETATFDFSDPDMPTSDYFTNAPVGSTLYKKQQKFLMAQKEYIENLLVGLDKLIPDYEDG